MNIIDALRFLLISERVQNIQRHLLKFTRRIQTWLNRADHNPKFVTTCVCGGGFLWHSNLNGYRNEASEDFWSVFWDSGRTRGSTDRPCVTSILSKKYKLIFPKRIKTQRHGTSMENERWYNHFSRLNKKLKLKVSLVLRIFWEVKKKMTGFTKTNATSAWLKSSRLMLGMSHFVLLCQ